MSLENNVSLSNLDKITDTAMLFISANLIELSCCLLVLLCYLSVMKDKKVDGQLSANAA